jgi:D-aspartate ligase
MQRHKTKVLVLGLGVNGLGVLRSLHRIPELDVWAINFGKSDAGRFTRLAKIIECNDPVHDPILFEYKLHQWCHDRGRTILFATRDNEVNLLAALANSLPDHFLFYRNSSDTVKALSDKNLVKETAIMAGLDIPRTIFLTNPNDPALASLRFPILIKPLNQSASQTPFKNLIAYRFDELQEVLKGNKEMVNHVVIQEFIPGGDDHVYECNILIDNDAQTVGMVEAQKIRQYLPLRGMTSYGRTLLTKELVPASEQLARQVGYKGLLNAEFKRDDENDRWVFIEANLRLTIFNAVFPLSGVNLANLYIRSLLGKVPSPIYATSTATWMHEENDLANIMTRKAQTPFRVWLRQFISTNSFAYWYIKDPVPGLYAWGRLIINGLKRYFLGKSRDPHRIGESTKALILFICELCQ